MAIPGPAWAKKVFPGDENAEEKLWQAIFSVCRVREGVDVTAAWREHLAKLEARRSRLNELQLESVHFESSNGTDPVSYTHLDVYKRQYIFSLTPNYLCLYYIMLLLSIVISFLLLKSYLLVHAL